MKKDPSLFSRHFLTIVLVPFLILAVVTSFYRFMILGDYEVTYEVECDPYGQSCYVWCEDDVCEEPFYYSYVSRSANDVEQLCGEDITDCELASVCTSTESSCLITYCDDEECDTLSPEDESLEEFSSENNI